MLCLFSEWRTRRYSMEVTIKEGQVNRYEKCEGGGSVCLAWPVGRS